MKITNLKFSSVNFKRALTFREENELKILTNKAKKILGNNGVSVLIMPDACLPSGNIDIGCGYLSDKNTIDFFKYMKIYTGINAVKVLPQGELKRQKDGLYCSYAGSGLSLGTQLINPVLLTTSKFNKILTLNDVREISAENKKNGYQNLVNFENVIEKNSPLEKCLKKAFENFKKLDNNSKLNLKFKKFKSENINILEPKAIFKILAQKHKTIDFTQWKDENDKNLYKKENIIKNKLFIDEIKQNNTDEIEFYYFKQFLAYENLKIARKNLNNIGLKLYGDCLVGFSEDERWAYPDAFENANLGGWKIQALKYADLSDKNSDASKLLKKKIEFFAKNYDRMRIDVAWSYISPVLVPKNKNDKDFLKKYYYDDKSNLYKPIIPLKGNVINFIENSVKEIKKDEFDQKDIIYETEAGVNIFSPFNWNGNKATLIPELKDKMIVQSTAYMNDNYGSVDFMKNNASLSDDNYIITPGNHDYFTLKSLALYNPDKNISSGELKEIKAKQIPQLAKFLNISSEVLKKSPVAFVKAKFAEIFTAKNNKLFYLDVFGRTERFDEQDFNGFKNYRFRIPNDYKKAFQSALEAGWGLNLPESLALALKIKHKENENPDIYKKLKYFGDILNQKTVSKKSKEI